MYLIKSPIFSPDKYLLCVFGSHTKHTKQIVLSNLHNIHKLPNIFVLTYTQQNIVWGKNWWFYKVHFSTLMVDFTNSSTICWNSERSEQFLITKFFFNLFLKVSQVRLIRTNSNLNWKKLLRCRNMHEKLEKPIL